MNSAGDRVPARDKPRILMVGPLLPPYAGMQAYVENYLRSRVTSACDVSVVCADQMGKLRLAGWRRQVANWLNTFALLGNVCWELLRHRPEIVHVQTSSFAGFWEKSLVVLLARLFGRKAVLSVHGGGFRGFYEGSPRAVRHLIRGCLGLNHAVIAATPRMVETLACIGVRCDRVSLLRNAVFVPEVAALDRTPSSHEAGADGAVQILFLNRVTLQKGLGELVEAAGRVCSRHPGARFVVAGQETPDGRLVRRRAEELGIGGRLVLVGQVSTVEKERLLVESDIYVLPSYVEDLPYGLLEAASYGLACVATPVGGIPSLIEDRVNGLLVPPRDAGALAAAIEALVTDPDLRRSLGRRARSTVHDRFNWESQAGEIVSLYAHLLQAGKVQP